MKKHIYFIIFIACSFLLASCNQQKTEWKGTIEEKDGVIIVKNPKEPIFKENILKLEEELVIENDQNKPVFLSIRVIRVDNKENIYVLDVIAAQVKVFDKFGKHLRNIGNKGQGPGEILVATSMELSNEKEIMIYDIGNRRISFFSLDGKFINSISTGKNPRLFRVIPNSNNELIGWTVLRFPEKTVNELKIYDFNLNQISVVKVLEKQTHPSNTIRLIDPVFSYQVLKNDNIIWGIGNKYEINICDKTGKVERIIIKDYDPIKITENDKKYEIDSYFGEKGIPPNYKIELPDNYPAYHHLNHDDKGRIIVRTHERHESGFFYDIFNQDGKYITKIAINGQPWVWKADKLYVLDEDQNSYHIVKKYKIKWEK